MLLRCYTRRVTQTHQSAGESTQDGSHQSYALIAGLLALFMWSGTAIANKVAVQYMSGLTAGVTRSMIAGVIALAIVLIARLPRPSGLKDTLLLVFSGLASFAVWPMMISIGVVRTSASHAAIAMAMIPIFAVLGVHLTELRLPSIGWWFGAIIAFTATIMLVLLDSPASAASGASAVGDLIIIAGSLICAAGYVAGGKLSSKIGSPSVTFWGLASALIVLVPTFILVAPATPWSSLPAQAWLSLGWLAFLSSLVGYGLWFYALGVGGIARIGSLQLGMPVATIVAAALILDETITVEIALVTSFILFGTWWAHRHS